jgi:predicted acyltransferase
MNCSGGGVVSGVLARLTRWFTVSELSSEENVSRRRYTVAAAVLIAAYWLV